MTFRVEIEREDDGGWLAEVPAPVRRHGIPSVQDRTALPQLDTMLGLNGFCVVKSIKGMPNNGAVIHSDPEVLGGTPVFVGTRVPFRNLIDYIERNHSLDEFLDAFPTVSKEQAVAALEAAHEAVIARARSPR